MKIRKEELSDLPLLAHLIQETGLSDLLDKHYPAHGNWQARRVLSPQGLLYVGDMKMGAAATFSLLGRANSGKERIWTRPRPS